MNLGKPKKWQRSLGWEMSDLDFFILEFLIFGQSPQGSMSAGRIAQAVWPAMEYTQDRAGRVGRVLNQMAEAGYTEWTGLGTQNGWKITKAGCDAWGEELKRRRPAMGENADEYDKNLAWKKREMVPSIDLITELAFPQSEPEAG